MEQQQHCCVLVPQTLYEYWFVATRPVKVNGLGFDTSFASSERDRLIDLFTLLRDERAIFENWLDLVEEYEVKGVQAHDTRYVAAMKRHGITHLLTFNAQDFRKYRDIAVLTPPQIVQE